MFHKHLLFIVFFLDLDHSFLVPNGSLLLFFFLDFAHSFLVPSGSGLQQAQIFRTCSLQTNLHLLNTLVQLSFKIVSLIGFTPCKKSF